MLNSNKSPFDEPVIANIKAHFGFNDAFDLMKEFEQTAYFLDNQKKLNAKHLRPSKVKEHLVSLIDHTDQLLSILGTTHPLELKEINKVYSATYPQIQYKDIQTILCKLELELNRFKAVCHTIKQNIGEEFSMTPFDSIASLINGLREGGTNISCMIGAKLRLDEVSFHASDFITSLKAALKRLVITCSELIDEIGKDSGRSFDSLTRNFMLKMGDILRRGTNKRVTAYYSSYEEGYTGSLYDFAMVCAPLFHHKELILADRPSFAGDLAIEAKKYLKELTEQKVFD